MCIGPLNLCIMHTVIQLLLMKALELVLNFIQATSNFFIHNMNRRLYSICKKSETLESLFFTINKAVWCGLFVHYLGRTYLHALLVTSARNHKMMLGNSTWFTIIPFKSLKRSFVFLHDWKSERGYCNMLLLSLLKFDIPKVPYWSKIW